jgi:hypothetical protein
MTTANDRDLDNLQVEPAIDQAAVEQDDTALDVFDDEELMADSGDLPQEMTESYGTGVHDQPGFAASGGTLGDRWRDFNEASPVLTGGDIDANFEQANAVGDESVGGTVATPDMDIVDELGRAVGLEMDDRAFLRTSEILDQRDENRWELEPMSTEDYGDRTEK